MQCAACGLLIDGVAATCPTCGADPLSGRPVPWSTADPSYVGSLEQATSAATMSIRANGATLTGVGVFAVLTSLVAHDSRYLLYGNVVGLAILYLVPGILLLSPLPRRLSLRGQRTLLHVLVVFDVILAMLGVVFIFLIFVFAGLAWHTGKAAGKVGRYLGGTSTQSQATMVLATFGPNTTWAGRQIRFERGAMVLDAYGPLLAADVLEYDRLGQLRWSYDGLREWVQQVAQREAAGRPAGAAEAPVSTAADAASAAAATPAAARPAAVAAASPGPSGHPTPGYAYCASCGATLDPAHKDRCQVCGQPVPGS